MQNRATLKQEMEDVVAQWEKSKNPTQTLAALERKRTVRWHHLGLAIASEGQSYNAELMHFYISLLTTLASNHKTPISALIDHLTASSPNDHLDLPAILVIGHKDAPNTQAYLQLLQTIANRKDTNTAKMAQLLNRRFRYNLGSDEQPIYDSSNLLIEITNELDKDSVCHYLQLLCALAACNKLDKQTLASIFRTPNSYPQNIGQIIHAKVDDPNVMLLLADLLTKLKVSNYQEYLPNEVNSEALLAELESRSVSERESLYPAAMSSDQPLNYLLRHQQPEVKRLFSLTRQDKLLETIAQMSPQEQIQACTEALDPTSFLGQITYAVNSDNMRERILQVRDEAKISDTHGNQLLQDIFATSECQADVISFTNTQTGLFKPAQPNDEDLSHAFEQAFSSPLKDEDPYERVFGTNR